MCRWVKREDFSCCSFWQAYCLCLLMRRMPTFRGIYVQWTSLVYKKTKFWTLKHFAREITHTINSILLSFCLIFIPFLRVKKRNTVRQRNISIRKILLILKCLDIFFPIYFVHVRSFTQCLVFCLLITLFGQDLSPAGMPSSCPLNFGRKQTCSSFQMTLFCLSLNKRCYARI